MACAPRPRPLPWPSRWVTCSPSPSLRPCTRAIRSRSSRGTTQAVLSERRRGGGLMWKSWMRIKLRRSTGPERPASRLCLSCIYRSRWLSQRSFRHAHRYGVLVLMRRRRFSGSRSRLLLLPSGGRLIVRPQCAGLRKEMSVSKEYKASSHVPEMEWHIPPDSVVPSLVGCGV